MMYVPELQRLNDNWSRPVKQDVYQTKHDDLIIVVKMPNQSRTYLSRSGHYETNRQLVKGWSCDDSEAAYHRISEIATMLHHDALAWVDKRG